MQQAKRIFVWCWRISLPDEAAQLAQTQPCVSCRCDDCRCWIGEYVQHLTDFFQQIRPPLGAVRCTCWNGCQSYRIPARAVKVVLLSRVAKYPAQKMLDVT